MARVVTRRAVVLGMGIVEGIPLVGVVVWIALHVDEGSWLICRRGSGQGTGPRCSWRPKGWPRRRVATAKTARTLSSEAEGCTRVRAGDGGMRADGRRWTRVGGQVRNKSGEMAGGDGHGGGSGKDEDGE